MLSFFSPELQTTGAPVPGEKANVVHTGATVIADIIASVGITHALASPLPRLNSKVITFHRVGRLTASVVTKTLRADYVPA